jgi:uncharacterized membrane protein HdeD (DUF308 family)
MYSLVGVVFLVHPLHRKTWFASVFGYLLLIQGFVSYWNDVYEYGHPGWSGFIDPALAMTNFFLAIRYLFYFRDEVQNDRIDYRFNVEYLFSTRTQWIIVISAMILSGVYFVAGTLTNINDLSSCFKYQVFHSLWHFIFPGASLCIAVMCHRSQNINPKEPRKRKRLLSD